MLDDILKTNLSDMDFMTSKEIKYNGKPIRISRCGYTGEDGFELSVPQGEDLTFAEELTQHKDQQSGNATA